MNTQLGKQRTRTVVWVKFQLHGMHAYPNAPDEVGYLKSQHRHLFHFKVGVSVSHDDREVEFHMLQNWLMGLYKGFTLYLNSKSCEMVCSELLTNLQVKYGTHRYYNIEVSEDNECGATLEYTPQNKGDL